MGAAKTSRDKEHQRRESNQSFPSSLRPTDAKRDTPAHGPSAHLAPRLHAEDVSIPAAVSSPPLTPPPAGLGGLGSGVGGAFSSSARSSRPGGGHRASEEPSAWSVGDWSFPSPPQRDKDPAFPILPAIGRLTWWQRGRGGRGETPPSATPVLGAPPAPPDPVSGRPSAARPRTSRPGRRALGTRREPRSRRPRRRRTEETPAANKGPGSPAPPRSPGALARPAAPPAPPGERLLIWSNDTRGSPGGARLSPGPAARTSAAIRRPRDAAR